LLLVLKVTAEIVLNYRDYFPPNFDSAFLNGREASFSSFYKWAFWTHLIAGPPALILSFVLVNAWFRNRFRLWHRRLGRFQALNVICLLAPSGLIMACYAAAGPIAALSFIILSTLTALTMIFGWKSAVARDVRSHRRWMLRNLILLCSAIVLRLSVAIANTLEVTNNHFDLFAVWGCWVVPIVILEMWFLYESEDVTLTPPPRHSRLS
jgi:hypothetical protein